MDLRKRDGDWKSQTGIERRPWVIYVRDEWNEKLNMEIEKLRGARVITNSVIYLFIL